MLVWVLQILAAVVYTASGVMKAFMFDKVSKDVPSFGALPRRGWFALGLLELACVAGLIAGLVVPSARVAAVAATALAIESVVFVRGHIKYREVGSIVASGMLGLVMAFVAYARF